MMYPYITLADETEISHSQLLEQDGIQSVEVHFERPTDSGFQSARCILPYYRWKYNDGFGEDEISFFEELLRNNAHLFYRFAKEGGIQCA